MKQVNTPRMFAVVLGIWSSSLVVGCASIGLSGSTPRPTEEEYEVFGAVLWEVFTGPYQRLEGPRRDSIPAGTYVLMPREPFLPFLEMDSMLLERPEVDSSAAEHYLSVNRSTFQIEPRIPGLEDQVALSRIEADALFREGGWDGFYSRYPNAVGLIGLSRVGFSEDGRSALVFVSRQHGGRNGEFGVLHLRRGPDGWEAVGWPNGKAISE